MLTIFCGAVCRNSELLGNCNIFYVSKCILVVKFNHLNAPFLLLLCPLSSSSQKIRMAISREQKELPENRWCQNDRIFEGFSDFQKLIEFLDFCISGFLYFFWISGHISGTKRATGDPLVSKRPDFQGLFRFLRGSHGLSGRRA